MSLIASRLGKDDGDSGIKNKNPFVEGSRHWNTYEFAYDRARSEKGFPKIWRPEIDTEEYYQYTNNFILRVQKYLPVSIYGMTRYEFAFHWVMPDGKEYPTPVCAPIEILEWMLENMKG